MKKIAWGASKLLKMHLERSGKAEFACCIDNFSTELEVCGIPIVRTESLKGEKPGSFHVVIFAVSNKSIQEISAELNRMGFSYSRDFTYYSDFFYKDFVRKAKESLGFELDPSIYRYALSYTLSSSVLIHTTILGTWLFLEMLKRTEKLDGSIAEVGAFEGGNALCSLNFSSGMKQKNFYILDSFEGFPELSEHDPKGFGKGAYRTETPFQGITDRFAVYPQAKVIKGFVPLSFSKIPANERFSLVFYDCDLYQPGLDTFAFFWDKIVPGGYLLIHDYETEKGGLTGG